MWHLLRAIFEFKNCHAELFILYGAFSVTQNEETNRLRHTLLSSGLVTLNWHCNKKFKENIQSQKLCVAQTTGFKIQSNKTQAVSSHLYSSFHSLVQKLIKCSSCESLLRWVCNHNAQGTSDLNGGGKTWNAKGNILQRRQAGQYLQGRKEPNYGISRSILSWYKIYPRWAS